MATVNIYLTFDGQCEEAFAFYQSVFGGEYSYFSRFKDMPQDDNAEPLSDEDANKVLHVSLPISAETCLMASDIVGEKAKNFKKGNNFSISIDAASVSEADSLFDNLSKGGSVIMPMDKTFWGSYFGMFTDKFGINWLVGHDEEEL